METSFFSIIIPARDEEDNICPLLEELEQVLSGTSWDWEVIVIDDASEDRTLERLREAGRRQARLKILRFRAHRGKSAALAAGIAAARGSVLGMMDADLQNCPAEFLPMLRVLEQERGVLLVQGRRVNRRDSWAKCQASRLGFLIRRIMLGDRIRDTGCGQVVMRREVAADLPLHFEGLHRFLPFLVALQGGEVREWPVAHRPRHAGRSKYHIGPLSRGWCGLLDLLAVRWMQWRRRSTRPDGDFRDQEVG